MDQESCTTIVSPDPRKSLSSRESHPGVIPDDPGLSRIKTFDRRQRRETGTIAPYDVGLFDEISMFNRALSAAEIRVLHELERGVAELHP